MKTNIDIYYSDKTPADQVYKLKNLCKRKDILVNWLQYYGEGSVVALKSLESAFFRKVNDGSLSLPNPFNYFVMTWTEFPSNSKDILVGYNEIVEALTEV